MSERHLDHDAGRQQTAADGTGTPTENGGASVGGNQSLSKNQDGTAAMPLQQDAVTEPVPLRPDDDRLDDRRK